ncbi:alpha-E domain-containing protein [Nocardia panacis]|uniref:Alpha-E domain-containing protein n=1 Tax=Nocardia panacis TaxID=2340916 RepID=A0A3A4K9N8_9NOCA|nr:alpha-E domain-containing protein [Nocardia panacis]RJO69883.1 alpha-E domain-containing protein [Nocardia panacis]
MLARNAESLYWIGRYVERADDTARLLDVAVHRLLADATVDPDHTCRILLRVLGIEPPHGELDIWSVTELVAFGSAHGGSIVDSIAKARENARGAREVTSCEMWECLNATYNGLAAAERTARTLGPHQFFRYIEDRAAMFAGLADSTLSRDDGYRFLLLGRAIERADMTVRLLLSQSGDRSGAPAWVSVLRSAGAHDTYLRTHRGLLDAARVIEFLLLDRLFPRSVFHSFAVAETCLTELAQPPSGRHEAQRLLGRARSDLEFLPPEALSDQLPDRLAALQRTCREVGAAIARQYFHAAPWVAWTDLRAGAAL